MYRTGDARVDSGIPFAPLFQFVIRPEHKCHRREGTMQRATDTHIHTHTQGEKFNRIKERRKNSSFQFTCLSCVGRCQSILLTVV